MVLFLPFAFNFYYSTIKIQNYNFVKLLKISIDQCRGVYKMDLKRI